MPDAPTATEVSPESSAGATPAPASSAASSEAPAAKVDWNARFDFDTVFAPQTKSSSPSSEAPKGDAAEQPPTEQRAPAKEAATTPDGAPEPELTDDDETPEPASKDGKKPSRTARIHEEYQGQINELNQKLADLETKYTEATGQLSETEQAKRQADATFLESYGDDATYQRLTERNNLGEPLNADEYQQLQTWTQTRKLYSPFQARALADAQQYVNDNAEKLRQYMASQIIPKVEAYGPDPEQVKTAEYGALIDLCVEANAKKLQAQHAAELTQRDEKISHLEAQVRETQDRVTGSRPEPERGGQSGTTPINPKSVLNQEFFRRPFSEQFAAAFGPERTSNGR